MTVTDRSFPYWDPQVDTERRVDDLLSRMTVEDKAALLFHPMVFAGDSEELEALLPFPAAPPLITERQLTHFSVFGAAADARSFAQWHNQLQRLAANHPLAIPITLSTDPRHHFTDNPMTSMFAGPFSLWPEPLGLAAIGDEALVEHFADIARQEYTAVGLRTALHPQIDLATEPRWCRISATFGEDAALTSRLVAAYIRGFQGSSIGSTSVSTMTKHFPGGGPQKDGDDPHFPWGREQVYPGGNFDYHLEPFKAAIAAGTAQIMPYYGMPIGTDFEEVGFSFNRAIITGILRERLGFDGVVCTDWGLVNDKADDGKAGGLGEIGALATAKAWGVEHLSPEDRFVKLLDAGVDQFGGEHCPDVIVGLVNAGRVTEARLDRSVRRLLRLKFQLGLFDDPFVDPDAANEIVGNAAFRAAGTRAQQRAMTLLTNQEDHSGSELLPLTRGQAIYAEGIDPELIAAYGTPVDDPAGADVAILRLKTPWERSPHGGMADMFHGGSLEFLPEETARVKAICQAVPTVIDIYLERPAVLGPLIASAAAIVANYGIEARALLDVLFGDVPPEGNLPFDLPRSMEAVIESRTDVPFDTADPAFPFGHGLRYADQ